MNISRRSLGFSLTLHTSLLCVGTAWLLLTSRQSGEAIEPTKVEVVKVTPVVLAEVKAPEPPPIRPAAPLKKAEPSAKPAQPARPRSAPPPVQQPAPAPATPVSAAPARPPAAVAMAPSYPQASARPAAAASARPKTGGSERRPSSPPPLWSPSPTPSSAPSPAEPENTGRPGSDADPALAGVVVDAYPLARIDVVTPKYMALKRVEIVARFEIAADGSTKVRLEPGTGIPAVDAEVLAYLQSIPWSAKTVGGVGVADVQELTFSKDGS